MIKSILATIAGLILFLGLVFGLSYFALFQFGFFAPKYAAIERQVFENTPSYLLGKEQEIAKDRQEYLTSNDDSKAIIKSVLRQSMAGVDRTQLSLQSQQFLNQLGL